MTAPERSLRSLRVAITGGIAEGKSTVMSMVAEMGFATVSSDAIAREVFQEPATNARLAEAVAVQQPISSGELRQAIAMRPSLRREVNRIMHEPVLRRLQASEATFFEVPLLVEACLVDEFDRVWIVRCGRSEQKRRLRERYGPDADVDALTALQLPFEAKEPFADRIFRTNTSPEHVRKELVEAITAIVGR